MGNTQSKYGHIYDEINGEKNDKRKRVFTNEEEQETIQNKRQETEQLLGEINTMMSQEEYDYSSKPTLFVYLMSWDTGIAPNPYDGVATLSCCMPNIRKRAKIGDYVIGLGSKAHDENMLKLDQTCGYKTENKIIWIGKVTRMMSQLEYHKFVDNNQLNHKKTSLGHMNGDCIYEWDDSAQTMDDPCVVYPNVHFQSKWADDEKLKYAIKTDMSQPVMICEEYMYYGNMGYNDPNVYNIMMEPEYHEVLRFLPTPDKLQATYGKHEEFMLLDTHELYLQSMLTSNTLYTNPTIGEPFMTRCLDMTGACAHMRNFAYKRGCNIPEDRYVVKEEESDDKYHYTEEIV